jgi:ABC-type glycerol-3-phosphate transport system substrate-binding protein
VKREVKLILAVLCITLVFSLAQIGFAAPKFKGEVVNALIFRSSDTDYIMQTLAPRLQKETGIILKVDQVPYDDVRAKQLTDAEGSKRYDIINPCTEWSYEYRNFAIPLNKYIGKPGYPNIEKKDIIPFVWKGFNPGKDICWMPYQPDTRIFFYRKDILQKEGLKVPRTWDELLNVAAKLTKDTNGDGKIDQYGFGFPAMRGWNLTLAWVPFVFAAGGNTFDANYNPVFNSQAGVDAMDLMLKLKKFSPPDVNNYGEYETIQATTNGTIVMGVSASSLTPEVEAANSPVKGKIATAMFPIKSSKIKRTNTAVLGGWAFGVSKYSKHKDAAAYTTLWLTSKNIVTEMEINGRQHAARLSMAKNVQLLKVNPHIPTIVEVLSGSKLFFPGQEGASVGELLNLRVSQGIAGETSPKEALNKAASEIKDMLKKAGYYNK